MFIMYILRYSVTVNVSKLFYSGRLKENEFYMLYHIIEPVNFEATFGLALAPFRSKVMYDISGDVDVIKVCDTFICKNSTDSHILFHYFKKMEDIFIICVNICHSDKYS